VRARDFDAHELNADQHRHDYPDQDHDEHDPAVGWEAEVAEAFLEEAEAFLEEAEHAQEEAVPKQGLYESGEALAVARFWWCADAL
jgi:hypothetical protein